MANYQPLIGFQPLAGTMQAPLTSVSKAVETIAEEFALDSSLPVLGEVMTEGRISYVQIPKFRAVGVKTRAVASNSAGVKPTLTIATGDDSGADPIGVAQFDFYKEFNNVTNGMQSVFEKRQYIRFPFINGTAGDGGTIYNSNLNGTLQEGMIVAPDAYGRPSKYIERTYTTIVEKAVVDAGFSQEITIVASGFTPYVPYSVTAYNLTAGAEVSDANTVLVLPTTDTAGALKVKIDDAAVADDEILLITFSYGHKSTKKYGTVGRILTGVDENTLAGFIRSQVNGDYPLAPIMNPVFATAVQNEVISTGTAKTGEFALSKKFIDLSRDLKVEFTYNVNDLTTYPYVTLDNGSSARLYANRELGSEFAVNALAGTIEIFLNRATSSNSRVRVSFSYKTAQSRSLWEQGAYGNNGGGIYGQTDGSVAGTVPVMKPAAALHPDGSALASMSAVNIRLSGIMNIMID